MSSLRSAKPYLVFLIEADLSVYPVPLMSVGTVVPLTAKRTIDVGQTAELMRYYPCFNTPAVIADPVAAVRATPGFAIVPDSYVGPMPERYADMPSLISGADLVMRTRLSILSPAGGGTAYGCLLAADAQILKNGTSSQPPSNVVVPLRPEPEEEYLVFFRLKSRDGNSWDLAARQGAVVAKSDTAAWGEAMALLKK